MQEHQQKDQNHCTATQNPFQREVDIVFIVTDQSLNIRRKAFHHAHENRDHDEVYDQKHDLRQKREQQVSRVGP